MNIKKIIKVQSESKKTGTSMLVEGSDGKSKQCPLFNWNVRIADDCKYIKSVEFHLHPTFTDPVRVHIAPPFEVEEVGYGSFDMRICLNFVDPQVKSFSFVFPLRLEKEKYEEFYTCRLFNVSPDFQKLINGEQDDGEKELLYGYDVEELSAKLHSLVNLPNGLQKVAKVIEMLKKFRSKQTYIEEHEGEFHFDLYTLSPDAVAALWDFVFNSPSNLVSPANINTSVSSNNTNTIPENTKVQ